MATGAGGVLLTVSSSGSLTNDINFSIFAASDSAVLFFSCGEGGKGGGGGGVRERERERERDT